MSREELQELLIQAADAIIDCIAGGKDFLGDPEDLAARLFEAAEEITTPPYTDLQPSPFREARLGHPNTCV